MAHHIFFLTVATILVTLLFLSPPTAANSPVLDLDGNPLEVGSHYYVLTSGRGAAGRGGLVPESGPGLCPRLVAQIRRELLKGEPVSVSPANPSRKQITQGDDVTISFGGGNYCRESGVWNLTFDEIIKVPYVATNGNPGAETSTTRFKIVENDGRIPDYKIVYCFLSPAPGIVGNEENCQQLDATLSWPNAGLSFLSLVPLNQNLPFFGFVFKKVDTTTYY